MTEQAAYSLHIESSRKVASMIDVSPSELAQYAFAVNKIENRPLDPKARNKSSSARGMMQMLLGTQKELETKYLKDSHVPDNIFKPDYAIYLGQYELARQYKRYKGDWRKAIHAYNRGSYQPTKSNTKGFAYGENYANSVVNMLYKTDFASLNSGAGGDTTAASLSLSHKEWS